MHKIFLASLMLLLPLPVLSETNEEIDKKYTISAQTEFNSLSQYGIIDYASAVSWCRKKISENYYDYELQIERVSTDPADFCRTYFIPSIQSKSRRICVECDLDPNLILANLVEAIKQPRNRYGSDLDISEEVYSEENSKSFSDQPEENSKSFSDQPEENSKSFSDQPEENSKSFSDQPEENSKSFSDQPEENSKSFSDQPEENSKSFSDQPEENSKSFSDQPEDESLSGFYITGSLALSKIADIDISGSTVGKYEFESGLFAEGGVGYDFGSFRTELTYGALTNNLNKISTTAVDIDVEIKSWFVSAAYDFRESKKWQPYIALGIGQSSIEAKEATTVGAISVTTETDDVTTTLGKVGMTYQYSDRVDVYGEAWLHLYDDFDFGSGTGTFTDCATAGGGLGLRYRF